MFSIRSSSKSLMMLSVAFVLGSTLSYVTSASAIDISGCANKRTGVLRVAKVCKSKEYSIVWSQDEVSPKGATGDTGATGTVGKYAIVALTDNAATLTAAQLVNNSLFNIITMGTSRNLTMDTGPNIASAYSGEVLGSSFEFAIWNRGAVNATLVASATATLTGTGVVAAGKIVKFLCMFITITPGAEVVACQSFNV